MQYKKIMILTIILTFLLAVSAVSAAENASDDIVSVDNDNQNNYNIKETMPHMICDKEVGSEIYYQNEEITILSTENNPNQNVNSITNNELILNEDDNNYLGSTYTKPGVEIMIADEVRSNAYFIRIYISNNLTGTLNVYVNHALKWTNQIVESETGNYGIFLYPNDFGMTIGNNYLVNVTFGEYSHQCYTYMAPEYNPTFDDLADKIKNARTTVDITKNYSSGSDSNKNGIAIDKDLVINGNGHYLDANNFGRIFRIYGNVNVTLINITFKNGKNTYGGAIHIKESNVNIVNCTFVNNYAEKKGCVIYSESLNNLNLIRSTFRHHDQNIETNGLFYIGGKNIYIDNCIFKNEFTTYSSVGLILNCKNITIKNCNFDYTNFKTLLSLKGQTIIDSCNFTRNHQCILIRGDSQSYLIKNSYFHKNGGTLIDSDYGDCNLVLYNSTFDNNEGYVVNWMCYSGEINSCKFLGNYTFDQLINYKNYCPKLINNTGFGVSTNITIDKNDVYYNDPLIVYLKDCTGKPLYFKQIIIDIGGYHYEMETKQGTKWGHSDFDGGVLLNISNIKTGGKYNANIYFVGDIEYDSSSLQLELIVNLKRNTYLQINNITSYQRNIRLEGTLYGENTIINDTFERIFYKTEKLDRNVTICCNNETFTMSNNKAIYLKLNPGTYEVISYYEGDDIYDSCKCVSTITVINVKKDTTITASGVTTVYNGGKYIVATLKDSYGNPLKYVKVTVTFLNGKTDTQTTNKYGQVQFSTNGLAPVKKYSATINFNGNANYEKSTTTVSVKVYKATPKITAKAQKFKRSDKKKLYTIRLLTNQNIKMKYTKVYIKVNGVKYSAQTNKKGYATFSLKKLTKKGKYKAYIMYGGNSYYNSLTTKVKLTVK